MEVALREPVDGEPDVELDLGLGGHRHELGVEEQLDPGLLDVVHEPLVGGVGVGGHGHQKFVAPKHGRSELEGEGLGKMTLKVRKLHQIDKRLCGTVEIAGRGSGRKN